mmetsp:Transcript_2952/g.3621  ORF Transcript_2952/g.3621 Transcript_2952/m.3621 type:complete len:84 (-) Transcript_2952:127-378(-)
MPNQKEIDSVNVYPPFKNSPEVAQKPAGFFSIIKKAKYENSSSHVLLQKASANMKERRRFRYSICDFLYNRFCLLKFRIWPCK